MEKGVLGIPAITAMGAVKLFNWTTPIKPVTPA